MFLNCSDTTKKFLDLGLVILYVLITTLFVLVSPLDETPVRAILGFPLLFLFPVTCAYLRCFPWNLNWTQSNASHSVSGLASVL